MTRMPRLPIRLALAAPIFLSMLVPGIAAASGSWSTLPDPGGHDYEWVLVDSILFSERIPAGGECVVRFDNATGSLILIQGTPVLTADAQAAVEVAPDWLKDDLTDNFSRLSPGFQDIYAVPILNASDPYRDEIAFTVAHLAPQTLTNPNFDVNLISENATLLYAIDALVGYADIVDYGISGVDPNYYSTISYRVYQTPDTLVLELPKEIYYWFVVHPKLHRELPTYINPANGLPADPPTGVFWRDFLFNHADPGYPLFRDSLINQTTLWNSEQNSLDNGALGAVTRWIQDVMVFQSHPHHNQPVRIYRLHKGTCSVYSYLTAAASRTALIPATVTVMYRDNHKLNEFWEREWMSWEPVNTFINFPEGYENWGWDVVGFFNWRGDGYTWNVTERYTAVCTLTVNVVDANGRPVDGVCVILDSDGWPGPRLLADYLDSSGSGRYLIGDKRPLMARVTSDLGIYPPSGFHTVTTYTVPGEHYVWNVVLGGVIPELDISPDTIPAHPADQYRVTVEFVVVDETVYGANLDDGNVFAYVTDPGVIDFFISEEEEFNAYLAGEPFRAFVAIEDSISGSADFILPEDEQFNIVFSNKSSVVVSQGVHLAVRLYQDHTGISIEPDDPGAFAVTLLGANPNPFTSASAIRYFVGGGAPTAVSIDVFDVSGRLVRSLLDREIASAGTNSITWNGRDGNGLPAPSGLYFVRASTERNTSAMSILLLR